MGKFYFRRKDIARDFGSLNLIVERDVKDHFSFPVFFSVESQSRVCPESVSSLSGVCRESVRSLSGVFKNLYRVCYQDTV